MIHYASYKPRTVISVLITDTDDYLRFVRYLSHDDIPGASISTYHRNGTPELVIAALGTKRSVKYIGVLKEAQVGRVEYQRMRKLLIATVQAAIWASRATRSSSRHASAPSP